MVLEIYEFIYSLLAKLIIAPMDGEAYDKVLEVKKGGFIWNLGWL